MICDYCRMPLDGDPDDVVLGTTIVCGECNRAQQFDDLPWQAEAAEEDDE